MDVNNTLQAVDSLCANEFDFEIEGESVTGMFRVTGLTPFKLDDDGNPVKLPFEVAKMVERDGNNAFNKWLRETIANRDSGVRPTRNIAVIAVDDGVETRRWTAKGAWIKEIRYSSFDSASFEMVEEIFTIMYDSIEETWSATENLQ